MKRPSPPTVNVNDIRCEQVVRGCIFDCFRVSFVLLEINAESGSFHAGLEADTAQFLRHMFVFMPLNSLGHLIRNPSDSTRSRRNRQLFAHAANFAIECLYPEYKRGTEPKIVSLLTSLDFETVPACRRSY